MVGYTTGGWETLNTTNTGCPCFYSVSLSCFLLFLLSYTQLSSLASLSFSLCLLCPFRAVVVYYRGSLSQSIAPFHV